MQAHAGMDHSCDLICISAQRWDSADRDALIRCARDRRVFFVEEPVYEPGPPFLSTRRGPEGVMIVQAGVPAGTQPAEVPELVRDLIERLMDEEDIEYCSVWFDTPRAPWFTEELAPIVVEEAAFDDAWETPASALM